MKRPVDAVIEFLEAEQARGKSHILLDESARDGLRELYQRARAGKGSSSATTPPATTSAPIAPAADATPISQIEVKGSTKVEQLASLKNQAQHWAPARQLGSLRDKMIFATGSPDAQILFVGEAPSYEDERRGEPFAGPAGQKLDDILKAMGITRQQVYLSNIVKFRPIAPRQTTNNRRPTADEMACFLPFIRHEIEIVQPACIVVLGATTAEGLLGLNDPVDALRDRWHPFMNIPVRVSYHPSYLLQNASNTEIKRKIWEDMLAVMEQLQLPISEKQRGFFLPR